MNRRPKEAEITSPRFKHRSTEILRIEALSDAVFAFSVSLLVASLEVPQTFHELQTILQGAIPFFATVAILFLFWYQQYIFFRHYALNDLPTIVLNLIYLAVILFYVYPLKFLFSLLLGAWTGMNLFPKAAEHGQAVILAKDFPTLIILFSIGYAVIWLLLYLMHARALRKATQLQLTPYETGFTIMEKRGALWNSLVGIIAFMLAAMGFVSLAGIIYLFIPLLLWLNRYLFIKRQPGTKT
jgi:uncharacterized membrane protein